MVNPTTITDRIAIFAELQRGIQAALKTYSNVHRGSGHNSLVTNHLYEQARGIVLEYLGLNPANYVVIFCTPGGAADFQAQLKPDSYRVASSRDIGLPLGIRALAVQKSQLPKGAPVKAGGGTARLVARDWIIWAKSPDRFEAGTPAIINVIAFARALQMTRVYGKNAFQILSDGQTAGHVNQPAPGNCLSIKFYTRMSLLGLQGMSSSKHSG